MADFQLDGLGEQAIKGSHFQFKSEKEWQSSDIPITSRFVLNLKTLAEDLQTIPFYERQNLHKDLFSKEEILKMDKEAENSRKKKQTLKPEVSEPSEKNSPIVEELTQRLLSAFKDEKIDESECKSEKKSDDLEDWLDSVLDD